MKRIFAVLIVSGLCLGALYVYWAGEQDRERTLGEVNYLINLYREHRKRCEAIRERYERNALENAELWAVYKNDDQFTEFMERDYI